MARYAVETAQREGEEIVALRDTQTGAEARVWPRCGNNCFQLVLPAPEPAGGGAGLMVTVIHDPPALDEIRRAPSWWGIPLLFPFPGSMPGGTYEFEGQRRLGYPEQPVVDEPTYLGADRPPNARRDYHGFVMDLPWKVAEMQATDEAARVRSTLDSADFPEEHVGFPFPYRVEAAYRLDAEGLRLDFRVRNAGQGRLPFGFGAHPFLRLPLGLRGSPGECQLCIPAARRWGRGLRRLLEDRSLPLPTPNEIAPPVSEALDLRTPRPFVERVHNGMYTDVALRDGHVEAFVRDPANGVEAVMRATSNLPNVVFWSPPGRPDVCFEPWSCPSNVFNLAARGVPGHGLVVLEPGQTWEASMWLSLRPAPRG